MNLFGSQRTQLLFAKAELKRNRDGERVCSLVFKVKLNGQNTRSTPKFVQESYRACKGSQTEGQIDGAIEVQNVAVYALPEENGKKPAITFDAVTFDHLVVRRNKESDIWLSMRTSIGVNKTVGNWILGAYGTEVWATFAEAQGKLLADLEELSDEADEADEEEESDDSESEPESATV